jgi:hypothetical protein
MSKLLIIILIAIVALLFLTFNSNGGKEDYSNPNIKEQCKQQCFVSHPEAARMYEDEDNDIAMTTIDQCVARCSAGASRGCSSCA